MSFVKLDCGILDSTLWPDREAREIFITSLLMAVPHEIKEPTKTIKIRSLDDGGYTIPPGFYGFVAAASTGIIRRAGVEQEAGLAAIERLSSQDLESRTPDHEGRRLVRVDGGFIVLNFDKYRKKDHTAAERSKRYRENLSTRVSSVASRVTARSVTQAEAEAEAEAEEKKHSSFSPESKMALDYLNQKTGSRFRETEANLKRIAARLKEPDITLEGVKKMIERQCALWGGTQMSQYLRPSTLFNTEKFNEYYAAKDQPTSFKPTSPASAPDKPLPTIADLRAKRQQQSQML